MPLYRKSELLQFLDAHDLTPRRSLSQNFLTDGNVVRKMLATAEVSPSDHILEIGPGAGAITELLLDAGAHVLAVEKDPRFAELLHRLQTPDRRLTLIEGDILDLDLPSLLTTPHKVISNLPFQVTSPILTRLVPLTSLIPRLTVLVQDEVARRYVASPGTSDYSSITLYLAFYSSLSLSFRVGRRSFHPVPRVDSAVLDIVPHTPPPIDSDQFFTFVRTAFQQRRKMLRSSLRNFASPSHIESALSDPHARPQDLSLSEWLTLFKTLQGC